jgi:hypothetical protein
MKFLIFRMMHHVRPRKYTVKGKIEILNKVLNKKKWTNSCPLAKDRPLSIYWFHEDSRKSYENILQLPNYVTIAN